MLNKLIYKGMVLSFFYSLSCPIAHAMEKDDLSVSSPTTLKKGKPSEEERLNFTSFKELPEELTREICSYLPLKDRYAFIRLCRAAYKTIGPIGERENLLLWAVYNDFPQPISIHLSYKLKSEYEDDSKNESNYIVDPERASRYIGNYSIENFFKPGETHYFSVNKIDQQFISQKEKIEIYSIIVLPFNGTDTGSMLYAAVNTPRLVKYGLSIPPFTSISIHKKEKGEFSYTTTSLGFQ